MIKKSLFSMLMLISILLILFSCAKHIKKSPVYKYLNEKKMLCYKNEADIGKIIRGIPKDSIKWLQFGDKVEVLEEKEINKKQFMKFKQDSPDTFWGAKSAFIDKFVVILANDIKAYNSPDVSDDFSIALQTGDFGIQLKENGAGFALVDFRSYHPYFEAGEQKFVIGQKWIKINNGITTITNDPKIAREAYFLSWAYYYDKSKNDKKAAIKTLKSILSESNNSEEKEGVLLVLQGYLKELENSTK